jgi:hypothetical protein
MEGKKYAKNNFFKNIFGAKISSDKEAINTAHGI